MILKSLTLQGFKSFPERTVIRFHEGVTAIVGPNGSGKSNVTDAIRWVLGEQSVKTLRASKMEELIFSGTASRRPLSYAEVTLTMDNEDRELPLDFPEIRVSRRIYRSGESEYLLNDSRCRLKDITELFLDTGIGRDGYSMIGQGKVDDILSGKAELRRKMLDEASGITKYKLRREESEKKLALTEQNLIRLDDIVAEIEKQKGPLERQAKKANTYLKFHEELKAKDLALLYYEIEQKEQATTRFGQEAQQLIQTIEEAEQAKQKVMAEAAEWREALQGAANQAETLQSEEAGLLEKTNAHAQELALAGQKREQIAARKRRYQTQTDELSERKDALEKEEQAKALEFADLKEKAQALEAALAKVSEDYAATAKTNREQVEQKATLETTADELRRKIQNVKLLLGDTETNRLARDLASVDSELSTQSAEVNKLLDRLDEVRAKSKELKSRNQALEREREERRISFSALSSEAAEREKKIHNLRYQKQTQQELSESYEGYAYPIKRLMEYARQKEPAVYGPLADLLEVPSAYEAAIESILGGTAQNIVVSTEDTASRMITKLKNERWGRATFLPLNRVSGQRPSDSVLNQLKRMPGYRGLASELVSFMPEIQAAVDYALGRTVVADTLDQALQMAKATSFKVRIASTNGDLLNPGGAMSGGSRKQQSSGILSRRRLLETLTAEISEQEAASAVVEGKLAEEKERISLIETELGQVAQASSELSREEIQLDSHNKQYEQNRIRLQSKQDQNQADLARLEQELVDLEEASSARASEAATFEQSLEENLRLQKELAGLVAEQNVVLGRLGEKRAEVQVALATAKEQRQSASSLLERVRREHAQVVEELQVQEQDLEQDQTEEERLKRLVEEGSQIQSSYQKELAELREKLKEADGKRREAVGALEDNTIEMDRVSGLLAKLGQDQGRLEQRQENTEAALMDLRARLWEEYTLTFASRDDYYLENLNLEETRAVVKELRQKIRDLGQVNVQAIEESREIAERHEFMMKQPGDILHATDDLSQIIREITSEMQKQFQDSFRFINEQFRVVFRELFGGGEAELVLEDSKDILNSPIEIKVMPPGKRLQNMLALSGGERCLTAIALLFAIQKLNPSPFCVLDEVEAALDEANVFRFTDYVKQNSAKTQYILVTHRRGTMEAARMIYGVTMQERGVSQIISVKLDES